MSHTADRQEQSAVSHLRGVLQRGGLQAALQYIAGHSSHRFVGVYRFDDEMLRTRYFHDRDNPGAGPPADIPVMSSYCCVFVRQTGQTFCVEDSLADRRVDGHAKQAELRAYCGVPLIDQHGVMYGTACVYDVVPRVVGPIELALLEALGPLLGQAVPA